MLDYLKQYLQYIENTGRNPLLTKWFDDDWEPIGPVLRRDLVKADWIAEKDDGLSLTDEGRKILSQGP